MVAEWSRDEPMKERKRGRRVDAHEAVIPIPTSAVPQMMETATESAKEEKDISLCILFGLGSARGMNNRWSGGLETP